MPAFANGQSRVVGFPQGNLVDLLEVHIAIIEASAT